MNTLHTPGPWQLTIGEYDAAIHNDVTIASISDDALAWEANARLISAAPELLVALKQCIPLVAAYANAALGDGGMTLAVARAAIAKAEGAK